MKLPLVPTDKANHFLYGFFIYTIALIFVSSIIALGIVFVAALAKEIKDYIVYKGGDFIDLLFTIIPGLTMLTLENIK
jgi:hypothetical protein